MKNKKTKTLFKSALVLTLGLVLSLVANAGKNPPISPLQAKAFGTTYEQLAADLWVRAFAAQLATHPHLETDGSFHDTLQSGKVQFLVGHFGAIPVDRVVTIPAGKAIFFPMIDVSDACNPIDGSEEAMRGFMAEIIDHVVDLWVTVDGQAIGNLFDYRIASNVFLVPGGGELLPPFCTGTPGIADGYYLLLPPLSKGDHIIEFGGTVEGFTHSVFGPIGEFSQDAVYSITVVE
jgi:hypothetical protein